MKPVILICLLTLLGTTMMFGQVKIGDNPQNIDPSSVLELESSSRVLVITRVNSSEMQAITPQMGGVVYNTDTECMHYYNGRNWINLCDATSFSLTNEPIENTNSTISIVDNGATINLEVARNSIRSENIVDGGINGDDIQDNSIGESKLGADSVGASELRDNAVGSDQIINGSITPGDIANTTPNQVLTTDTTGAVAWQDANTLRGAVADEVSITGAGTIADPLSLTDAITGNILANTTAITAHVSADNDTDNQNEVLTNAELDGTELVLTESGVERRVDLSALNNAGTDNQTLNLTTENILEIDGGNFVDLNGFLDNTDTQQLELDGNTIRISGGNEITLPAGAAEVDGDIRNELQDLSYDATSNILTISTPLTAGNSVDLSSLAGGGTGSTEVADQITITGTGTIADPFEIAPGSTGQFLTTDAGGLVTWTNAVAGGGSTELADQITIIGDGQTGTEFAVADAGITPIKMEPSATPGQFLSTDAGGNVVWDDLPVANGITAADVAFTPYSTVSGPNTQLAIEQLKDELDAATIAGGGENPTNELQDILLTGTVLSLTTPATAGNSEDLDTTFATDAELLAAIAASSALDLDINPENELSDIQLTGTTLQLTNPITGAVGVDLDPTFVTQTELTALSINDADFDPENELSDIQLTGTTLQLTNPITGAVGVDLDPTFVTQTELSAFSGNNLANKDLIQITGENRTYNLNSNNLYFTGSGNIGIGTTSPQAKFHVSGGQVRAATFSAGNGTVAYRFTNDPDTGMYNSAADELAFNAGAERILLLKQSGTNGLEITADGSLTLAEQLIDETGNSGNEGDVLTATTTGTRWSSPQIVAMGKYNPSATNNPQGATVGGSAGNYQVRLNTPIASADYIIQLTVESTYTINFANQTSNTFDVIITKTDGTAIGSPLPQWFFTVSDF